jgi:ADP-ribosylglycohydrolase
MDLVHRFRGAILGLAIGDALGMPVEGLSSEEIRQKFGRVVDFLPSPFGENAGEWTDDTEQMIVLAESILENTYLNPENFANRLKSLAELPGIRIGPTTREALQNLIMGVHWSESGVYADTCGAAMRVLPVGLVYNFSLELVERYAVISSIVTHRGEAAVGGAVAVAIAVACICSGMEYEKLIEEVVERTREYDELLADKIRYSFDISDIDADIAAKKLGTSMLSWDAVPMAFYCFLSSESYEECVLKAVNTGGDTDSIAAMACGMKGAEVGIDNIPEKWVKKVKDGQYLVELADRLYNLYEKIS